MSKFRTAAIAIAAGSLFGPTGYSVAAPSESTVHRTGLPACAPDASPGWAGGDSGTVFFDWGSSEIRAKDVEILKTFAALYRKYPDCILLLDAHTDSLERVSSDRRLDDRRARAVVKYLRRFGVTMRTRAKLLGDTQPFVETPKGVAEPQNRFVGFVMVPETFK